MSDPVVRQALPEEMEEIYRLRYKVFCEELKFLDPNDYPDGKESDQYDDRSYHIVVLKKNKIVGYTRLVLFRENEKFPIEEATELPKDFKTKLAVEVSRGIVIPDERGSGVKGLLMKAVFDYCRNNSLPFFLSFSNKIMFDGWKKSGVKFLYCGERVKYHGFDTWPLIISIK